METNVEKEEDPEFPLTGEDEYDPRLFLLPDLKGVKSNTMLSFAACHRY